MLQKIALGIVGFFIAGTLILLTGANSYEKILDPNTYVSHNFDYVGYHDLAGKAAFKMALQQKGDRWYLVCAHFTANGWSILDVTDPSQPQLVKFLDNPEQNTNNGQIQLANDLMITSLERPLTELMHIMPWQGYAWLLQQAAIGKIPYKPWQYTPNGILIWDVKDPINPVLLSKWTNESTGTHRNFYDGGNYVYLTANRVGFRGNFLIILDISNPKEPREIGEFFLPEQKLDHPNPNEKEGYYLHGPTHVQNDTAYLPYGIAGGIILDVKDKTNPKQIGAFAIPDTLGSVQGLHTFLPLLDQNLGIINGEAHGERCTGDFGKTYTAIIDLSDITQPSILSFFPEPVPPKSSGYASFCDKGGRTGPHNQHHHNNNPLHFQSDSLVYVSMFNAGLRLYRITDPTDIEELAYFIPPNPTKREMILPTEMVVQTEDVIVDKRGYAYISQKNDGIYIVKYTAEQPDDL